MADEEPVFETTAGPVRVITAASLFDGHDAAINVMRRLIQSSGAEVIHLGHDQSAKAVVDCAIQEDAHAVALTSYQGGHVEYFSYIRELLDEAGCEHVRIFGGGGGTITPPEIRTLHQAGISKIYSPDDGRSMGLMGMIHHLMGQAAEVDLISEERMKSLNGPVTPDDMAKVGLLLTLSESADEATFKAAVETCRSSTADVPVIGFTGTGGAGKSSLLDELMLRIQRDNPGKKVCLLCVDPTRKRTGGALLGDRIRMNSLSNNDLYMRSLASRGSGSEISANLDRAIEVAKAVGFDMIFCETSGIGQGSDAITSAILSGFWLSCSQPAIAMSTSACPPARGSPPVLRRPICATAGAARDKAASVGRGGDDVGRYGHGLGIQLTEPPSHTHWDNTVLTANMALTLEPSLIYDDGFLMVAEENILITESGVDLLSTRAASDLPVIV